MNGAIKAQTILREILGLLTQIGWDTSPWDQNPWDSPIPGCGLSLRPCRVAVYPGGEVPWDACGSSCASGDGQLYAVLTSLSVQDEPPCTHTIWTAEIGVVRCAAPMADDGTPPSTAAVEADAYQQALDADEIRRAITCCAERSEDARGIVLVSWRPEGPQGGCVGGTWTVRGVLDDCC